VSYKGAYNTGMESGELTTRELVTISLYQSGYSVKAIALKLGMALADVRALVKSSKAIAYLLDQEEATDQLVSTLYRDGVNALSRGLNDENPQVALKAAELTFKVLGKMKPATEGDTSKHVHIDKLLQIIGGTISPAELEGVKKYFPVPIEGEVLYGDN
jgi:hypothetical protein